MHVHTQGRGHDIELLNGWSKSLLSIKRLGPDDSTFVMHPCFMLSIPLWLTMPQRINAFFFLEEQQKKKMVWDNESLDKSSGFWMKGLSLSYSKAVVCLVAPGLHCRYIAKPESSVGAKIAHRQKNRCRSHPWIIEGSGRMLWERTVACEWGKGYRSRGALFSHTYVSRVSIGTPFLVTGCWWLLQPTLVLISAS